MRLEIFDVEHGQCSLLTSDAGAHMMIDAGHNTSTGWRPSKTLSQRGISILDRLLITNCDEDHVSDLSNVLAVAQVRALYRNRSVGQRDILQLKGQDPVGSGIAALAPMLDTYIHPVLHEPDFGGLEIKCFWNRYPADFEDENNLSMLSVLTWPNFTVAYPGDLEVAGWRTLLQREEVRQALKGVNVLVASHHGRLNGFTPEIFESTGMRPYLIVISDSGIDYESQETGPIYRKHAVGAYLDGKERRVLTTRRDGSIAFDLSGQGLFVTTSKSGPALF